MAKPLRLSVKVVITNKDDECLILRRSMESKGNPGKWDFPGGKVEFGEYFDETLFREVREETGLSITVKGVVGTAQSQSNAAKFVYVIMEARKRAGQVRLSSEHDAFRWVNRKELSEAGLAPHLIPFARIYSLMEPMPDLAAPGPKPVSETLSKSDQPRTKAIPAESGTQRRPRPKKQAAANLPETNGTAAKPSAD